MLKENSKRTTDNSLSPFGGQDPESRRCFPDVINREEIKSATQVLGPKRSLMESKLETQRAPAFLIYFPLEPFLD